MSPLAQSIASAVLLALALLAASPTNGAAAAAAISPIALPGPVPPLPPNVTVVAGGFSWIENLCFDGNGSMFASERLRGQLLRIRGADDPDQDGEYVTDVLLDGVWSLLLGCAVDEARHPGYVFFVGKLLNGTYALAAVPTAAPEAWQVVATTPDGFCGNGIRIHEKTGKLYTSSEGNFLPGGGAVFEVDLSQPWGTEAAAARVVGSHLWASDGLWIDQQRDVLYVGLLFTAEVWTYSLSTQTYVLLHVLHLPFPFHGAALNDRNARIMIMVQFWNVQSQTRQQQPKSRQRDESLR